MGVTGTMICIVSGHDPPGGWAAALLLAVGGGLEGGDGLRSWVWAGFRSGFGAGFGWGIELVEEDLDEAGSGVVVADLGAGCEGPELGVGDDVFDE
jgi:hypothetical protein